MTYAELTTGDPNRVKRWLQRRRLRDAIRAADGGRLAERVLDVGAGNGCLAHLLADCWPRSQTTCYEPAARLRAEAEVRLRDVPRTRVVGHFDELADVRFDVVYCLEVLEHLARRDARRLLARIESVMGAGGRLIVGVPNELHAAAAAKGLFRMARRYASFDARPAAILRAALGRPPLRRVRTEVAPGLPYYPHHLGFDYRRLAKLLEERFAIERTFGSPWPGLPRAANSEIYFVCRPRTDTARARRAA